MPIPVLAADPLIVNQSLQGVGFTGERPTGINIGAEPHHEDTFALLWHPVVGCIHEGDNQAVGQSSATQPARGLELLQAVVVVDPALVNRALQLWKRQLQLDLFKVVAKAGARQALDVFDDEGPWLETADHVHRGRKHVAGIQIGLVFAAH